jgi:phosphoserine phosphatase
MRSMKYVLTLIANPKMPVLTAAIAANVAVKLAGEGASLGAVKWLKPGVACDLPLEGIDPAHARLMADEALTGLAVDYAVQEAATRVKKLLIADMDSTMIEVECIDELADFMGLKDKVARITEAAMRGELDFKQALRERVAMLTGMHETVLQQVYDERVTLMPGGRELIGAMNKAGARTILVSGGFTFFTGRVSAELGFQVNRANVLEISGGKLTGKVLDPIVDSATKLTSLQEFSSAAGLDLSQTMAVGDGANDIPMIQAAGLGIAYHAKPKTAAAADVAISYGDLTALLYLQGYGEADFA